MHNIQPCDDLRSIHCYQQAGCWGWCNSWTILCRPPVFLTFYSLCRDKRKNLVHVSDVCIGYWGLGRITRYEGVAFFFHPRNFSFAPDAPPDACTISIFNLPTGLKGCILRLGHYLPTVPSASPATHKVRKEWAVLGNTCIELFAPCILLIEVHVSCW